MKVCPQCRSEFEDIYNFCLKDGTPLVSPDEPQAAEEIEQETIIRTDNPSFGEKTEMMENRVTNEEVPPEETDFQAGAVPTEEWQGETPSEQWQQQQQPTAAAYEPQDSQADQAFAAAQIPVNQEQTHSEDVRQVPPPKESRSHLGLILGVVAVFGLLLLGTVIGGVYFLMQSRQTGGEVASANANVENQATNEDLGNAANSELTIGNGEDTEENNSSNSEDTKDEDDTAKEDAEKKKTPTPTPKPTPKDEKPTPTPRPNIIPNNDIDEPPPPPPPTPPRPPRTPPTRPNVPKRISGGVVNGKATSLPKPAYPAAARAANVKGAVTVAVVISKSGSVISASAVSGHPLLRSAAVSAARRARFAPTLLNGQPVEVSGVIVYNFQ